MKSSNNNIIFYVNNTIYYIISSSKDELKSNLSSSLANVTAQKTMFWCSKAVKHNVLILLYIKQLIVLAGSFENYTQSEHYYLILLKK